MVVVEYVEERIHALRTCNDDKAVAVPPKVNLVKLPTYVDCPQQESDSVDCGVAVLHMIRNNLLRVYKNQAKFTYDESAAYRTLLVDWMLDPGSRLMSSYLYYSSHHFLHKFWVFLSLFVLFWCVFCEFLCFYVCG